jgi:hypothetical protein
VTTWRIDLARNDDGTITITSPEGPPEWVSSLVDDLSYRLRDSPDAVSISAEASGHTDLTTMDEEPGDGATAATGPVTSTGPGTPPPDAINAAGG